MLFRKLDDMVLYVDKSQDQTQMMAEKMEVDIRGEQQLLDNKFADLIERYNSSEVKLNVNSERLEQLRTMTKRKFEN
jgi:hypothetical protein